MSDVQQSRTGANDVEWTFSAEGHALGGPFHSVWSREMINLNPDVWEIKLTGNQVIPAHVFGARTVQMFTSGSVPIDGEGSCGTGDVRWAEGGVHSGAGLSLVSGWTFVMRLEFDPGCIAAAHSHPGNIIYIVVEGEMTIP